LFCFGGVLVKRFGQFFPAMYVGYPSWCRWDRGQAGLWLLLVSAVSVQAQSAHAPSSFVLLEVENEVQVLRAGAVTWDPGSASQILYPGDQIRTAERSRALLRLANQTTLRIGELTVLRIPEAQRKGIVTLDLFRGVLYFFRRDKRELFEIQTTTVSAVVRGTEFTIEHDEQTGSSVVLLAGELSLSNEFGSIELRSGESAVAEPGQSPRPTAVLDLLWAVQWCLYYPAIVDPDELTWSPTELDLLSEVLDAYRSGDLQAAAVLWPTTRPLDTTDGESASAKILRAAVLLAVGGVAEAEILLSDETVLDSDRGTSAGFIGLALRSMMDIVRLRESGPVRPPYLATEWLAESYARQSVGDLNGARRAAFEACRVSPGFAWLNLSSVMAG
jgi:hypothetical protein